MGPLHRFRQQRRAEREYMNTSRDGFLLAHNISAYSLTAVAKAKPLMAEGGSIVTLTYIGAERVIPNYNVMGVAKASLEASVRYLANDLGPYGIRVNSISAGPIRLFSSKVIGEFNTILNEIEEKAPLRRMSLGGNRRCGVVLFSDLSRGITGKTFM